MGQAAGLELSKRRPSRLQESVVEVRLISRCQGERGSRSNGSVENSRRYNLFCCVVEPEALEPGGMLRERYHREEGEGGIEWQVRRMMGEFK